MVYKIKTRLKKIIKRKLKRIIHIILSPDEPYNKKLEGTILVGENRNNIVIGENVTFSGNVYIHASALIEIGDGTMIAYDCKIHTSTHDYNDHPMWAKRIDRPIKIGKHVWIGTGAIILGGVNVEDYSVIGAGCVISKNVPKGAIVVGNPAKILKYRDPESYSRPQSINEPFDAEIIKQDFIKKYYI